MTSIQFRKAAETDFEAICQLMADREELFLIYPRATFPFTVTQLRALADARKELTVAVNDDRVVGFANLYNYQAGKSVFIGNVVVDKDYRGKGLGRQIVEHMLEVAFQKYGLPEVHISVFSHNTPALQLYRSFGFQQYESEERKNFDGNKVELIHMKLEH